MMCNVDVRIAMIILSHVNRWYFLKSYFNKTGLQNKTEELL